MATYPPPTETLPTFNSTVFTAPLLDALTIAEADARYLKFPIGQGDETISNLDVVGTLTTDDIEPSSVSTTLDIAGTQLSGTLNIGTLAGRTGAINIGGATAVGAGRTINIGTTSSSGTNPINIAGSLITIGSSNSTQVNINPNTTSGLNLGHTMTGGTLNIGQSGATVASTAIGIGNGSSQTGTISIGTGTTTTKNITIGTASGGTTTIRGGNASMSIGTSGTLTLSDSTGGTINMGIAMTSGSIIIGGTTGGTSTLTLNRPITPAYLPSTASADTIIGYKANIAGLVLSATYPITTANITTSAFTIPIGVFLVNIVVKVNFATALGGLVFLRLSLSTASGTIQDARTIDFNPNDAGNNFLNYSTTISNSTATSYFLVGASGGTPNPTITSASTIVNITRIA